MFFKKKKSEAPKEPRYRVTVKPDFEWKAEYLYQRGYESGFRVVPDKWISVGSGGALNDSNAEFLAGRAIEHHKALLIREEAYRNGTRTYLVS